MSCSQVGVICLKTHRQRCRAACLHASAACLLTACLARAYAHIWQGRAPGAGCVQVPVLWPHPARGLLPLGRGWAHNAGWLAGGALAGWLAGGALAGWLAGGALAGWLVNVDPNYHSTPPCTPCPTQPPNGSMRTFQHRPTRERVGATAGGKMWRYSGPTRLSSTDTSPEPSRNGKEYLGSGGGSQRVVECLGGQPYGIGSTALAHSPAAHAATSKASHA